MSKKMMKRSLALGALMAFVITGSAMAAELTIANDNDYTTVKSNAEWFDTNKIRPQTSLTGNTVTIVNVDGSGPSIESANIFSGYDVTTGTVSNNIVNINGGNSIGNIRGGYVYFSSGNIAASANNNIVNIGEKADVTLVEGKNVYGGYASSYEGSATANNNTINVIGKLKISGTIGMYAGYAGCYSFVDGNEYNANENKIVVGKNGELDAEGKVVYVGSANSNKSKEITANVTHNQLIVGEDAIVKSSNIYVANANAKTVIANLNSTDISGTVNGNLILVNIIGSDVSSFRNSISIHDNAAVSGNVKAVNVSGGNEQKVDVNGNNITVSDKANIEGDIYAVEIVNNSNTQGVNTFVTGNKVIIEDETTVKNVYGVKITNGTRNESINVSNNEVNISESVTVTGDSIYSAYVMATCNDSSSPGKISTTINNNTVNISGDVEISSGTKVYGGYAVNSSDDYNTGYNKDTQLNVSATGNTVNISGNAVVKGEVYGGYAKVSNSEEATSVSASASNNEINLSGNADVKEAVLVGSQTEWETAPNVNKDTSAENTSNNTLILSEDWTGGAGGKAIKTVSNFDTIKIESADADNPIKIENLNLKKDDDNSNGTAIVVDKLQLGSGAQEGDSVKLFEVTGTTDGVVDTANSQATVYVGTAEMGNASLGDLANGGIDLTIQELDMNPQVLVIGESRAAATAFVNQGSELVETGLDALARDNAKAGDTKAFAAVYGNASEYATGSHVKVNGWSGIVGVGKTNNNGLTVGAFFENGDGNYRTYNVNAGTFMRGDGEAVYNGGGLLVRKDNANGVYTEASLRMGNLKNELKNAVMGKAGLDGYDVDTFYYGAHVGIGKVIPRGNEGDSIDVYGKFMYTHHDGETFNIQGDDYKFDSVDSERLRLGFRINEVQTSKLSMYYGAAWEYEFGGDADNKVVGYDLSTPSLGGSTMIGEIGMHYLASEKWSLDLNVRGYSGQRDGFTGSVQANYNF